VQATSAQRDYVIDGRGEWMPRPRWVEEHGPTAETAEPAVTLNKRGEVEPVNDDRPSKRRAPNSVAP
jgi:hypothetical protein